MAADDLTLPDGFNRRNVSDAEIRWVIRLHKDGLGRNAIARETAIPAVTVSGLCADLGLSFDRTRVRAATAARVADAKSMRAALQVRMLEEADALLDDLRAPTVVFSFGGRDNVYEEHAVEEPPAVDKLKLMQAATAATDRALKLAEFDAGDGAEQARSMLGDLARELGLGPSTGDGQ